MFGSNVQEKRQRPLSRIGRKPIPIPAGVEVTINDGQVTIKGPSGALIQPIHPEVRVKVENGEVIVERVSDKKLHSALQGLSRSLIANAIKGVTEEYQKTLEIMGVGYRVQQSGNGIILNVGLSHTVDVKPLPGVTLTVEGTNRIHVRGCDKQTVGEMAAVIRRIRPPNPYKEKGIRYAGEVLRLKPGKAAARKK